MTQTNDGEKSMEDILASIRRIVSEEEDGVPEPEDDALLLTPAMRIESSIRLHEPPHDAAPTHAPLYEPSPPQPDPDPEPASADPGAYGTPEDPASEEDSLVRRGGIRRKTFEVEGRAPETGIHPEPGVDARRDFRPVLEEVAADVSAEDEAARAAHIQAQAQDHAEPQDAFDPDDLTEDDPAEDDGPAPGLIADDPDDQALEDMVRRIVREELSGALGDKISRNLRKMVRREIQRALTAREMD